MNPKPWDKPVELELGKTGKYRVVTSTREAAECLLYKWPAEGGDKHLLARLACIAVLEGNAPTTYARDAFIAAAKEAGIFIRKK